MYELEEVKRKLAGMSGLFGCYSVGSGYDSKRCHSCPQHDNCADVVLLNESEMATVCEKILEYIENHEKEASKDAE